MRADLSTRETDGTNKKDGQILAGSEVMVIQAMPDAKVLVPDGGWILGAKFSRQGQDLILVGKNGEQLLIRDFFRLENPPDILTEGGSLIRADLAV